MPDTIKSINAVVKKQISRVDTTILNKSEKKTFEDVKKISAELDEVSKWQSYIIIRNSLKNFNPEFVVFKEFERLIMDKQLLDLNVCLKHVQINRRTFDDGLSNPISLINYVRIRGESSVDTLYTALLDLESPDRIGQYAQRLPLLWDSVLKKYPNPSTQLPSPVAKLILAKDDIVRLIHNTIRVALIYQSLHDLNLYILVAMEKSIVEKSDKLKTLDVNIASKETQDKNMDMIIKNKMSEIDQINLQLTELRNRRDDIEVKKVPKEPEDDPNEEDDNTKVEESEEEVEIEESED